MSKDKLHISISVVMPVYNMSAYVDRCLLSVMKQTYPATECIIVDDFSTDDSIARCQHRIDEYTGDTRFTFIHHDKNRGLSAARNTGTNAATSDYVYYLDSDDEITPDCLEKLVAPVMRDKSIEMVMGRHIKDYSLMSGLVSKIKQLLVNRNVHEIKDPILELQSNAEIRKWFYQSKIPRTVSVWNKLLKLSFIKNNNLYNKEGQLFEDVLWTYYLLRSINHVVLVPEVTYLYRCRPDSIASSTDKEERLRQMGFIYKEMAERVVPGERAEETIRWLSDFCKDYVDTTDNPNFQFAYNAFVNQLSDGKHENELHRLIIVQIMSKSHIGRIIYRNTSRVSRVLIKVLGVLWG